MNTKTKVFINSVAVGILLLILIYTISYITSQIQTYLQRTVQGKMFVGEVAIFSLIFILGFGGSLLGLIVVKKQLDVVLASAIGIGLINFAQAIGMGLDISTGVLAITKLLILILLLRYLLHFFSITAPLWESSSFLSPSMLLGLVGIGSAVAGGFLGSVWTSDYLRIAMMSGGSAFIAFSLLHLIHYGHEKQERAVEFGGILTGFLLILVIETFFFVLSI